MFDDASPGVGPVTFETCSGGIYGAPQSLDSGTWPLGVRLGTGASNVIETHFPLATAPHGASSRIAFLTCPAEDPSACVDHSGSDEAMLTDNGAGDGAPMLLDLRSIVEVPTLGEWGLGLLALLLAFTAVRTLRAHRNSVPALLSVALLVTLASGVAWAAIQLVLRREIVGFESSRVASERIEKRPTCNTVFDAYPPSPLCRRSAHNAAARTTGTSRPVRSQLPSGP